jgi:hypothetical protein
VVVYTNPGLGKEWAGRKSKSVLIIQLLLSSFYEMSIIEMAISDGMNI